MNSIPDIPIRLAARLAARLIDTPLLTISGFVLGKAIGFGFDWLALAAWVWIILTIRSSPLKQGKHDILAGGTRVVRSRINPAGNASNEVR